LLGGIGVLQAAPLSLQADISNLGNGDKVTPTFTVIGTAYNAGSEGPFTSGGLRSFYRYPSGRYPDTGVRTFPDVPLAGELPFGTNSEFAANATGTGTWLKDDAAFRSVWGIPGSPSDQWLPPFLLRKYIAQTNTAADDVWNNNQDWWTVRMEGRLTVASGGTYTLSGSGDDRIVLYVDGRKVWDQWSSYLYNGQVYLSAGDHPFTADFQENGGGQGYGFGVGGNTLSANPQDEHTFSGWIIEYGRYFETQRVGMLTMAFQNGRDGSTVAIGTTNYFKDYSYGQYGDYDVGPAPQSDSYRMYMVGYWNVPADGTYHFRGWADDRYALAVTNDDTVNPWLAPVVAHDNADDDGTIKGPVALTAGWKPFRMEFGEGGGGAWWQIQWSTNAGASWSFFYPTSFRSTADKAYDWTYVTNLPTQFATNAALCSVSLGDVPDGLLIDLRLRAIGTDISSVQDQVQVEVDLGGTPVIRNEAPSNTTATTAAFRGYLSSTGTAETSVRLYWGITNGLSESTNWSEMANFGVREPGPLSTNLAIIQNVVNFYRYYATNAAGDYWATNTEFVVPGDVTVVATDNAAAEMPPENGVFTITRPAWSTGVALTVYYALSGTAANGTDYSALPGSVVVPVGAASATVTVYPVADTNGSEGAETVVLTVLPDGHYVVGTPASDTVTISDFVYTPMSLKADIQGLVNGQKVLPRFTLQGVAYNQNPEGAFVPGGLEAFNRPQGGSSGSEWYPLSSPVPDVPGPGELASGYNSVFATNPTAYNNWWILNDAAFRAANGIPQTVPGMDGHWLPPWNMRKAYGVLTNAADDNYGWSEGFVTRMEGRLVLTNATTYTFSGGGDDGVILYLYGLPVYHSGFGWRYPGTVSLPAGSHPFTADFLENGGGQWYSFNIPPGATLEANPRFLHTFAGWTVELGRWYEGAQRPGMLTKAFKAGQTGSGAALAPTNYFKTVTQEAFGNDTSGCPQYDDYRMLLAGYWYVPMGGTYAFTGGADDRWTVTVSDNPAANPWTIPVLAADNTTITGVSLTQGWRPIRIEFGEGGGGAHFAVYWSSNNGANYAIFNPSNFMSTTDRAFDWTLLTNGLTQVSNTAALCDVKVTGVTGPEPIRIRLRSIGSDISLVEETLDLIVVAPKGTLFMVR
jgi:hypothetical protein